MAVGRLNWGPQERVARKYKPRTYTDRVEAAGGREFTEGPGGHACVLWLHWECPPAPIQYGNHWPRVAIYISFQIIKMKYNLKFSLQSYQPRVRCSVVI